MDESPPPALFWKLSGFFLSRKITPKKHKNKTTSVFLLLPNNFNISSAANQSSIEERKNIFISIALYYCSVLLLLTCFDWHRAFSCASLESQTLCRSSCTFYKQKVSHQCGCVCASFNDQLLYTCSCTEHTLQLKGFSPLCMSMCLFRLSARVQV